MSKTSRRNLAAYGVDRLLAGEPANRVGKELAAIIVDSGKAIELEFLIGDIAWELEQRHELAIGKITSAHGLDNKVRAELIDQLRKAIGTKEVLLEEERDESLIGGLRVETATQVWDYTIARKLSQLREMF